MFKIKNIETQQYFKDFSLGGFVSEQQAKSFKTEKAAQTVLNDLVRAGYSSLRLQRI